MVGFDREESHNSRKLIIWDCDDTPPQDNILVFLWSNYNTTRNQKCVSIPELVEKESVFYREKYLNWIYELGEVNIDGKRLIDHLEIEKGFSYWWMTWISHKPNYYESPQINDVVKCFAFETLYSSYPAVKYIEVVSRNTRLKTLFSQFCSLKNIQLKWVQIPAIKKTNQQSLFLSIPSLRIKALVYFLSVFFKLCILV
jgi:surface carbohydrate biosynthesis protein (TIGR04326 family)